MKTTDIPTELQTAIMQSLHENLQHANKCLRRNYPQPTVNWRQRGSAAATAWPQSWEIRLNAVLLLENREAFVRQVVPHELAHLLVWRYFGRVAPHGKEWKWMMENVLGVPAKRTHQFSLQSLQQNYFPYRCHCRQHYLAIRRHNRVLRGDTEYRCTQCKEVLKAGHF